MNGLREDIRYVTRSLVRSPTLTLVIVLTLALGIGLNTAIFSVVRGVLLKPLAFRDPSRLMLVSGRLTRPDTRPTLLSGSMFSRLGAAVPAFSDVAAVAAIRQNLRVGGELPVQVQIGWVSANFFSLLGVDAALGRRFGDQEAPGAVMLGDDAWRRLFHADPRVIGRAVALDGFAYTIVGVLPASFELDLPTLPRQVDVWKVPDSWWQNGNLWASEGLSAGMFQFIARLTPGVNERDAAPQVARFAETERQRQTALAVAGLDLAMAPLQAEVVREAKPILVIVSGAVGCVLLIVCANVMNLLLVRAQSRRRELAVRLALGSSRARLIRLMMVESAMLTAAGGVGGCLAAVWCVRLLVALRPISLPRVDEIGVDASALVFATAIALACPFVFGLVPALRATRKAAAADIRGSGSTPADRVRAGRMIAAGQLAISIVLLIAAGLLGESLVRLSLVRPGFDAANLLTFSVSLPGTRYHRPDGTDRFIRVLEDRIATLPNVRAVGTIWPLPLSGRRWAGNYVVGISPEGVHGLADYRLATAGLFDALGNSLVEGRTFRADDSRDVVIVSRGFARRAWPNEDPLGRIVQAAPWGGVPTAFEVIGITDDVRARTIRVDPIPTLYFDSRRWSWTDWEMNVVVRAAGDPPAAVRAIRSELGRLDGDVPMAQIRAMSDYVADDLAANRFTLMLVGAFATVALVLAVLGLYGVVAYAVGQRTREFGLRIALGADRGRIVRLVLGDGVRLAAGGVGAGLLGALWVTQMLEGLLFGTGPGDPTTFVGVTTLLSLVVMIACYVPARRAARVEPIHTLRAD